MWRVRAARVLVRAINSLDRKLGAAVECGLDSLTGALEHLPRRFRERLRLESANLNRHYGVEDFSSGTDKTLLFGPQVGSNFHQIHTES